MKSCLFLVLLVSSISLCYCDDLIMGMINNNTLIWKQKATSNAIPRKEKIKQVFFANAGNKIIKGIILRDLDHSRAIPSITVGGLDNTYVSIRLKGERGQRLNYEIEIYI